MSDKSTPRPWKPGRTYATHNQPVRSWETAIVDERGNIIGDACGASEEESASNAALIVRAVNQSDQVAELVEAAKETLKMVRWGRWIDIAKVHALESALAPFTKEQP